MSKHLELQELPHIHGAMAQFTTPEALIRATERAYAEGYRRMDAYAPMPVDGLAEALGYRKNYVALCVLIGGVCGAIFGFTLLEWIAGVAYPHNVGGRPWNSWPSYIPITFECMILFAALTSMISMFAFNKLPQPYHPVFNVASFARASKDRFFLCLESSDPKFRMDETLEFLRELGGSEVSVVPA